MNYMQLLKWGQQAAAFEQLAAASQQLAVG